MAKNEMVNTKEETIKDDYFEKWTQKTFKEISLPMSLQDILSALTKTELDDIRKQLQVKNASGLKKADLADLLTEEIPHFINNIIHTFDEDRYHLLTQLIRNNGVLPLPFLEMNQIEYLRTTGFIFTGMYKKEKVLVIPQDLLPKLEQYENNSEILPIIKRNTEWVKLTHGMLYYYGSLRSDELFELLEKYTIIPDRTEFYSIIIEAVKYYENMMIDQEVFSDIDAEDPDEIKKEHEMRAELEFYPFTKKQLLAAGDIDFIDKNTSFLKFVTFLTNTYDLTREEAEDLTEECAYLTRMGAPHKEVFDTISRNIIFDTFDDVKVAMDHTVELLNNTPQRMLKGHCPSGLSAKRKSAANVIDFHAKKKVGRNDPCLCGSGKKYKKCCGK